MTSDLENTSTRDPLTHIMRSLIEGSDGYIMGMEASGQRQLVASDYLPTDGPWDKLEDLGFVRGAVKAGDELFTEVTLPEGWRKEHTDHSMWSKVVDENGVQRVSIFYKAAFYDRQAFFRMATERETE